MLTSRTRLVYISLLEMAQAVVEKFGRIDVLVNNAALYGSLNFAPFDKLDEKEWDATMNVNVKGIWQCCKAVLPTMKKQQSGSIINISSLAAMYGMPNGLHYTTSKAAVIGATRGLARELGRYNIRVNAVAPNVVNTDATGDRFVVYCRTCGDTGIRLGAYRPSGRAPTRY